MELFGDAILAFIVTFLALIWETNGAYEMILKQEDHQRFSSSTTALSSHENDPSAGLYSIIGTFDSAKQSLYSSGGIDDKFQFKLEYYNSDSTTDIIEWRQSNWLMESTITGADLFDVPAQNGRFKGLGSRVDWYGLALLVGDPTGANGWWNAVGTVSTHGGAIPAFNEKIAIAVKLYILNPGVDECDLGTDDCDENAICTNTAGSYLCECAPGYDGDGSNGNCIDMDECTAGTGNCDENASCTNTPGSFTCACNSGYTGDGVTCTDVCLTLECEDGSLCVDGACQKNCDLLDIDDFLTDCSDEFEGHETEIQDLNNRIEDTETDITSLQSDVEDINKVLVGLGAAKSTGISNVIHDNNTQTNILSTENKDILIILLLILNMLTIIGGCKFIKTQNNKYSKYENVRGYESSDNESAKLQN
mmetsp:Transcript_21794/g.19214  ORF Transcript_21794/g.19214 Transcript_21794/m.19214 type:complete len:420 (-) Transcript_21794:310-1569(-)